MSARTVTVLEANQDLQTARHATRGILAAASHLPTAAAAALRARIDKVAVTAAAHAADVEGNALFPQEAIAAARAERLLGIAVPREFGGDGASIAEVADICYALGRACASTAVVYAMHQTKVACIARHGQNSAWHQLLLRRLASEQLLLASSTTEGQSGGDVRNSSAAVERNGARISLAREATVISYGRAADGIVTTARRSADTASSDQVLAVFLKSDYTLDPVSGWDAFGMRGTCSEGIKLTASAASEQILPMGSNKIHAQTMMPVAHLLWSSAWAGIAAAAVGRARDFVRKAAQRTRANSSLPTLRSLIATSLRRFEAADAAVLETIDFQTGMNLLKVNASELAVGTVMSAMQTCGLSGYRNDGEFSIGRHLRDILSSPVMINNDRILANVATASLVSGIPDSLSD